MGTNKVYYYFSYTSSMTAVELEDLRDAMIRANDAARLRLGDRALERKARDATAAYEAALRHTLSNPPTQDP